MDDDDLFGWFDREEGKRRRDEGMGAALDAEDEAWKIAYRQIVEGLPMGWQGTGEDIRFLVREVIGDPHTPEVWGGMLAGCIKRHWLQRTGVRPLMRDPRSHARSTDSYVRLP